MKRKISLEEQIETDKKYLELNKEKIETYHKKYYEENKEKMKAYSKKYHEEHREESKEKGRIWRLKNKGYRKEINPKYKKNKKEKYHVLKKKVIDNLFGGSCFICGEVEYCCLCFHHLNPETKEEKSHWQNEKAKEYEKWLKEGKPDDMVLVCMNCHFKIHYEVIKIEQ